MVHSSDNKTALYQEPYYVQVKEMVVCVLPNYELFFLALAGNCSLSV